MTRSFVHVIEAALLGLLGGGRNIDSFNRDSNFLVNRVSVGGRGRFWGVDFFFDEGNLGILRLVITLSSESAVHDNSKDPEHPEENANSTAKNECDGSTLPTTQIHERVVDTIDEGSFAEVIVLVAMVMVVGVDSVVLVVRTFQVWVAIHVATVVDRCEGNDWGRADDRQDHNLAISMTSMTNLDKRQTKSLPENVGNLHCFLVEAIATATAARGFHSCFPRGNCWDSMAETEFERSCIFITMRYHQKRYRKDLGNSCTSNNGGNV